MKRFGMYFDRLLMANSRQYITAYEIQSNPSHASYTQNRYSQYTKGHEKYNKLDMIRNYFNLILLLFFANNALNAQVDGSQQSLFNQIYSAAEKEYGIHQELINGVLFEYKNQDIMGHPYFLNYNSNQGSAIYRGKQYSDLFLRYDIYDQQVLIINLFNNVDSKFYLQKEFITEFNIENKKFINAAFCADEDTKFYQVIGENFPIKILYFWQKSISNLYVNNSDKKMFSSEQKKTFILLNNKLVSFKGNKSFIREFSSKSKMAIKKYVREKKIKVKHANDYEMELMIDFINTLNN